MKTKAVIMEEEDVYNSYENAIRQIRQIIASTVMNDNDRVNEIAKIVNSTKNTISVDL